MVCESFLAVPGRETPPLRGNYSWPFQAENGLTEPPLKQTVELLGRMEMKPTAQTRPFVHQELETQMATIGVVQAQIDRQPGKVVKISST